MAVDYARSGDVGRRPPPSNIVAEMALLGACLCNPKAYTAVSGFLQPDHFLGPNHGRIFQAISRRIEAGQTADPVTLKGDFDANGSLDEVGGAAYLMKLVSAMVGINVAADYGRVIHDCWLRRQLIEVAEITIDNAYGANPQLDGVGQIGILEDEIVALRSVVSSLASGPASNTSLWEAVAAAVDRADGMARGTVARPYSTGLPCIDRILGGGFAPNTLTYMVGSGGAGKTELALQIAEHVAFEAAMAWIAAKRQGPMPCVLYIMLGNMTATQLGARTAARYASMRLAPIRRGNLVLDEAERLLKAMESVAQVPVEISDRGPSTKARVLGDMRRVAKRRPLILTVVDNLSDVLSGSLDKMFGTAISFTKDLKELGATATNSSVLLLQHMNSSAENGRDRTPRPRVSDIPYGTRKDADGAFGVWRPALYMDKEPPKQPSKKLTVEGEQWYLKEKQEWEDKRQPWPIGIGDITEVVPMKLREEDDETMWKIGKLRFDRNTHRYFDVEAEPADADMADWSVPAG